MTSTSSSTIKAAWQADAEIAARYINAENATRPFAKLMLEMADAVAPSSVSSGEQDHRIFDLGCGTGAIEAELYARLSPADAARVRILAGDVSPPMLAYLAQRAEEQGWSGVTTRIVDGTKLDDAQLDGAEFDRVYVCFAVFMLPVDTPAKLAGLVRKGGVVGVSSWADLPWFPVLKRAYEEMGDEGPGELSRETVWSVVTNGKPWFEKGFVKEALEGAGLKGVEVRQERVRVKCGTPDMVMLNMGFVLGILSQQWPEEKREGWLKEVNERMRAIIVEQAGGEDGTVFWEFEGIVGVGVKGE